jgi:hypothetical protein
MTEYEAITQGHESEGSPIERGSANRPEVSGTIDDASPLRHTGAMGGVLIICACSAAPGPLAVLVPFGEIASAV